MQIIRHEDLVRARAKTLERLAQFLGCSNTVFDDVEDVVIQSSHGITTGDSEFSNWETKLTVGEKLWFGLLTRIVGY